MRDWKSDFVKSAEFIDGNNFGKKNEETSMGKSTKSCTDEFLAWNCYAAYL